MRIIPKSLRGGLVLFATLSAFPAMVAVVAGEVRFYGQAHNESLRDARFAAAEAVQRINALLDSTEGLLAALAAMQSRGDMPVRQCAEITGLAREASRSLNNIGLANPAGDVTCSAVPLPRPVNIADREDFRQVMHTHQVSYSGYGIGRVTGRSNVSVAYPVLDGQARLKAVAYATVDTEAIARAAVAATGAGHEMVLVDHAGTIISRSAEMSATVGQSIRDTALFKAMQSDGAESGELTGDDHVTRRYMLTRVMRRDVAVMYVALGIDAQPLAGVVMQSAFGNLAWTLAVLLAVMACAWLATGPMLMARFEAVAKVARHIASGDFSARIETIGEFDELGEVELAINEIAQAAAHREQEIRIFSERMRRLVDATSDALVDWDLETGQIWTNSGYQRLHGVPIAENPRATVAAWLATMYPPDAQRVQALLTNALRVGQPTLELLYRTLLAGGESVTVKARCFLMRNAAGRVVRVVGGAVDMTQQLQAADVLSNTETSLRVSQKLAHVGSWRWDLATGKLTLSDEMARIFGLAEGARTVTAAEQKRLYTPASWALLRAALSAARQHGTPFDLDLEFRRTDGAQRRIRVRGEAQRALTAPGGVEAVFGTGQDLTDSHQRDEMLRLLSRAVDAATEGIVISSADGDFPLVYVNAAFERMSGYSAGELIGQNCRCLNAGDRDQPALEEVRAALRERRDVNVVLRNFRKDGSEFMNELQLSAIRDLNGEVTHFVGIQSDVSQREATRSQLAFQATHDLMTGLPNRVLLHERLHEAVAKALPFLVLMMDVDRFKVINEGLGHEAGDVILKELGARLQAAAGPGATVARLGGDEFVVLMPLEPASGQDSATQARRVTAAFAEPIDIVGSHQVVTCSVGVAQFPADGADGSTLLGHADLAMYHAKLLGRNALQFFTSALDRGIDTRLQIENDIRRGLDRGEFRLHYQPQIDALTGELCGLEALVRWNHPTRGLLHPAHFIGIAEESGLIIELGRWVMLAACRQNQEWRAAGLDCPVMAVNVSALQFRRGAVLPLLREIRQDYALSEGFLELEVTESLLMDGEPVLLESLEEIRSFGVSLAIDDFGTGYSSLAYLKRLPIDRIKIDRSFVQDISRSADDATLCTTIIALAHNLGVKVVAEGVEHQDQADFLVAHGCDVLQGYLFAKPMDAVDMATLLAVRGQFEAIAAGMTSGGLAPLAEDTDTGY